MNRKMANELTDEQVFGTQPQTPVAPIKPESEKPVAPTPKPAPKLELSDAEVFGKPKELTDKDVFGTPTNPIDQFVSASQKASEAEKTYKTNLDQYQKFSALPLTAEDEPERIRLYAGARNAERAYRDEIGSLNKLRPAYNKEVERIQQEEISSIQSLGQDPNFAPIIPQLLDLREQRAANQNKISETILDPDQRQDEFKRLQKEYADTFKKTIDGVNTQISNRQNRLNELAAIVKQGDEAIAKEQKAQSQAEATMGTPQMFSFVRSVPIDEMQKQLNKQLDEAVADLPPEQREQYKKEARLIIDLSENKVNQGIVNNRLQVAPAILFDDQAIEKALGESEASDMQKKAFTDSLPTLRKRVADMEIGPLSQSGEFQSFITENNLEDSGSVEQVQAFKNADRAWYSKLGTQARIGIVQAHQDMIGQIQATIGAGLYAYEKSGMATDPEGVHKLSQAFAAAAGDQLQKVEDLQVLSDAIGGPKIVADLTNTGYQMLPILLPSFGVGLAAKGMGLTVQAASDVAFATTVGMSGLQSFGSTYNTATQAVKDRLIEESIKVAEKNLLNQGVAPDEARARAESQAMSEDKAQELAMRQAYVPAIISGLATATVTALGGKIGPEALLKPSVLSLAKNEGYKDVARAFLKDVGINAAGEFAEESVDQFIQGVTEMLTYNPEKSMEDVIVESLYAGGMGAIFGAGGGAIEYAAERVASRIAQKEIEKDPLLKALLDAADSASQAAERATSLTPQTASAVADLANQATAKVAKESTAREAVATETATGATTGTTVPETRTIADAIRDKDTFRYQGMRGAITEEDGEVVFREFGTQKKYIVPVAPEQKLSEIEELDWQRKGQTRKVTGEPTEPTGVTGEKPIEPTVVVDRPAVVERNPVVTNEEYNGAPDDIKVPNALFEIEKSPILNFLADLFDTGDSRAVQTEKAEYKSGKRKGETYERETESPVTELPEYYRQATPEQLDQAKRLIDSALRLIDTMSVDEATKERLSEHFLLLDQDITNYEQNPEHQKYRQERGWQVSTIGETGAIPTTLTEAEAADRELEQRVRAEAEALERQRALAEKAAATPPEVPDVPTGSRIKAAAYVAPDGTIYTADSHLNAMQQAADEGKITQEEIASKQKTASRETPWFGFATESDPFITRDQAETLAKVSGQILVETPETGKLHSNEVALDDFNPNIDAPPYIARAIVNQDPISVEDVDRAGVELPKGWVVNGDVYVFAGTEEKEAKPIKRLDAFERVFGYVQDFAEKNPQYAEILRNKVGLIVKKLNDATLFKFPSQFQDVVIDGISNRLLSAMNRGKDPSSLNAGLLVKSALSDAKKTYPKEYARVHDSIQAELASGKKLEDVLSGKLNEADAELTTDQKKTLEQERRRTQAIERRLRERRMKERIISDFEQTLDDDERLAFEFVKAIERSNNDPQNKSKRRQAEEARVKLEDNVEDYERLVSSVIERFALLAERVSGQELTPKAPKVKQTTNGKKVAAEQQEKQGVLAEVDAELAKTEDLTENERDARNKTEDPNLNNVGSWIKTLSKNDPVRRLMEQILKVNPNVANVPIRYVASINGKYDGFYDPNNNRIVLPQRPTQDIKLLIAHEIVHAATLGKARLYDNRRFGQLTKDEINIFRELDKIRGMMIATMGKGNKTFSEIMAIADPADRAVVAVQAVKEGKIGGDLYALVNTAEFLANSINNTEFQKALDTIDPNIFRQIWNFVRALFYGNAEPSASVNALWDSIVAISRTTKIQGVETTPAPSFVLPEYGVEGVTILESKSDLSAMIDLQVFNKSISVDNALKLKAAINILPDVAYEGVQVLFADKLTPNQAHAFDMSSLEVIEDKGASGTFAYVPYIYVNTSKANRDIARSFIHENAHFIMEHILEPETVDAARAIYDSLPVSRQAVYVAQYAKGGDTRFAEWFAESMTDYYEKRLAEVGVKIPSTTPFANIYKSIFDLFSGEQSRVDTFFDGLDASLSRAKREIARQAEDKIAPAAVSLRSNYENATKNGDYTQAKLIEEDGISKILDVLTPDLLKKEYREANKTNETYGHCYAASEALYHMLGGKASGLVSMVGRDSNGVTHWWLRSKDGRTIDPTATQYTSIGLNPPYEAGKGAGFLTKEPSKRAQTIIDRVNAPQAIAPAAIVPQQDRDYLDAVERGDLETAQKMVDEAAMPANQNAQDVFQTLLWFNDERIYPEKLETSSLGVSRAVERGEDAWDFERISGRQPWIAADTSPVEAKILGQWLIKNIANVENIESIQDVPPPPYLPDNETSRNFRNGVVAYAKYFRSSADPVTRDDQGNIIPLSQRFDITRPQIAPAAVRIPPEEGGTLPPATSAKLEELGVRADETQIVGTERTYKRILETIARKGMSILDFGSGLGHGLKFLKDEAKRMGFEALGYEPMWRPDRKAAAQEPDYIGFESLDLIPDNSQDYIINNAVLNVVDQDTRSTIVKQMYDKLKQGGTMFVQARSWTGDVQKLMDNPRNMIVGPREFFVPSKQTFQKGFTADELINFVETQLPDATVVRTQFGGIGIAVTKPKVAPETSIKTLAGTTIKRYKNLVGKQVGEQIYVHKNYASEVIPADLLDKAPSNFTYNTVMYNTKTGAIRFDEAPNFDTAREPRVGNYVTINPDGTQTIGKSESIWHHKWLWVKDDYAGFDVAQSKNWSRQWLSKVPEVAKGTVRSFEDQLKKYNVTEQAIAPAAVVPKISKVNDEYDNSRVGTATQGKVKETTQDTNVSIDTVKPENLAKQMAGLNQFISGVKLPSFITSIKDPLKKRDAFINFVADNLLALYEAFPVELRAAATRWYDGARKLAESISKDSGLSVEQAGGIMAAFSPMKDWFQNVEMAIQFSKLYKNHLNTKITASRFKEAFKEITQSSSDKARRGRIRLLAQLEGRTIDGLWKEAARNEARARKIQAQRGLGARDFNALPESKNAKKLRVLASWAARVVATQEYGLDFNVYSPDGAILGKKLTKDETRPKKMVWQSATFIEKALSIAYDGSAKNISKNLGTEHKIRSFYNNIVAPNSPYGDTTVDTHAVNAGVLFPMGNKGKLVNDAFGKAGVAGGGNSGIYWLFREAYVRAAARAKVIDPATGRVIATGIQPRQMQSITWEAIRGLFPDDVKRKKSFVEEIANIWKNAPDARTARNRIVSGELRLPDWSSAYTGGGRGAAGTVARARGSARSKTDIARGLRNRVRSGDYGIAPAAIDPNFTPDPDSADNTSNNAATIAANRADAKIAQESVVGHSIMADEIPEELREELEATYKNGMTLEEFLNSDAISINESYYPYAIAVWLDLNGGLMPTVKVKDKKIEKLKQGTSEAETVRMLNRAFSIYDGASEGIEGKEITYKVGDIVSTWLRSGLGEAALRNAIIQFTNLDVPASIAIAEDTVKQYGIQQRITDSKDRARVRMDRAIPAITSRQEAEKERMIRLEQAAGTIDSIAEAIKLAYDVNVNKARVDRATEKKQIQEQLRQAKRILKEVVPRQYLGDQLTALERASGIDGLKKIVEVAQDALNKARLDYAVTQARKSFDRAAKAVKAGTLTPAAEAIMRGFVDQYTKSGMSDQTKAEIQAVLDELAKDPINALTRLTTTKGGKQVYAIDKYIRRKGGLTAIKIDSSLGLDALREITALVNATIHMDKMAKGELLFNKKMKRDEWKKAIMGEVANIKTITKETEGFGPKLGGFKWNAIFKGARVENILRGLGLESMRKFIYENLVLDAYNDEIRNRIGLKKSIESAVKQITGLEVGTKDYDKYSKQLFDITGLDQNGNRTIVKVRRSELIDMVASLRDSNNFKKAVRSGGYVIDRLRGSAKGDTVEITPQSYVQIQNSMTQSDLDMADFIVGLYNNELFTLLNDASVQSYGHGIKKTDGIYYPRNAFEWDRVTETSEDLDYMQYWNSRVDSVGHLKERTDEVNARLVAVDFLSRLDYHVTNDSRISAYLPIVQDINSILKDSDVMRPLEMKVGRDVVFQIREMVRQQTIPLPGLRDGLINTLVGNAGIGILGFKIHAALQNPVGIPIAMAYYGNDAFKYTAKALGFLRKGFSRSEYVKMAETLNRHTPYFAERYGEGGFIQEFTSGLVGGPTDTKWRKNMEDKSLSWLEMTDKMGALARYKTAIEVIKDRTDLKEGTEEFDRAVAREWNLMMFRSENTSHGADRTGWFQMAGRNPIFKVFIMFQSAVSKQYSLFAEAVIQAQQGGRQNLQDAAMKMGFVAASVYMSLAISSAFFGILFPPDEEDEKTLADVMGTLLSAPLSIVPVLGNTLQSMVSGWFSPENVRKPMQIDIISSFIFGTVDALDLTAKTLRQMGEGEIDTKTGNPKWWNTSFKAVEKGLNLLGVVTGTPIGGLLQSGKFVKRLGERAWDGVNGDLPSDEEFQKKLAKIKRETAPEPTTQEYAKMYFAVTENNQNKFNRALRDLREKNPNASRDTMLAAIRRRPEFIIVSMVDRGDIKIGEHGVTRDEYLSKKALRRSMEQMAIDMWRESRD